MRTSACYTCDMNSNIRVYELWLRHVVFRLVITFVDYLLYLVRGNGCSFGSAAYIPSKTVRTAEI